MKAQEVTLLPCPLCGSAPLLPYDSNMLTCGSPDCDLRWSWITRNAWARLQPRPRATDLTEARAEIERLKGRLAAPLSPDAEVLALEIERSLTLLVSLHRIEASAADRNKAVLEFIDRDWSARVRQLASPTSVEDLAGSEADDVVAHALELAARDGDAIDGWERALLERQIRRLAQPSGDSERGECIRLPHPDAPRPAEPWDEVECAKCRAPMSRCLGAVCPDCADPERVKGLEAEVSGLDHALESEKDAFKNAIVRVKALEAEVTRLNVLLDDEIGIGEGRRDDAIVQRDEALARVTELVGHVARLEMLHDGNPAELHALAAMKHSQMLTAKLAALKAAGDGDLGELADEMRRYCNESEVRTGGWPPVVSRWIIKLRDHHCSAQLTEEDRQFLELIAANLELVHDSLGDADEVRAIVDRLGGAGRKEA